jgi:hypothetical protein
VLFDRAAKAGYAPAQFYLAQMYSNGEGVKFDIAEATRLYRVAAVQGYPPAQAQLGLMYARGRIGPPDYMRAYIWLTVAQTFTNMGVGRDRDLMAATLSPDDLARANAQVASCLKSKFQDCGEPAQ